MQSKKFTWNSEDTKAFLKESLKVLAPYILVILPVLIGQIPADWAYASVVIFLLQRLRSAILLFIQGK